MYVYDMLTKIYTLFSHNKKKQTVETDDKIHNFPEVLKSQNKNLSTNLILQKLFQLVLLKMQKL